MSTMRKRAPLPIILSYALWTFASCIVSTHRADAREDAELHRLFGIDARPRRPRAHALTAADHHRTIERQRLVRGAEDDERAVGTEARDRRRHGARARRRRENHARTAEFFQRRTDVARGAIEIVVRAELARERRFVFAARDGERFEAHLVRELHAQMAEAADTEARLRDRPAGRRCYAGS